MQNDKPIYLSFLLTFALTACGGGGGGSGGSGFTNSGTTTPATIASSSQDNQLPTSSFSTQTSSSSITGSQLQLISSKRRSSGSSAEISSAASSQIRVITSSSLSSSSYSSSSISSNKSSSVSSSSSSKLSSSSSSTLSSSSSSKPSSSSSSSQFSSSTSSNTTPVLLWHADFNDGIVLGAVQDGATASVVDGAYKLSYPQATDGGQYSWLNYNPPANTKQLYISFKAKMPGNKAGLKFFKVHGQQGPGGSVSNTTVGLDYTGIDDGIGSLYAISFGDGKDPQNDTQNVILLNGEYPDWIGRSYGTTANVQTPMKNAFKATNWGTEWHTFKIMLKFNDGTSTANEIANGAYYLEIDGNVYANATGLFNRHYNSGYISHIEFGGWAQGSRNAPNPAFDIYYDDIVVSSGGWVNLASSSSSSSAKSSSSSIASSSASSISSSNSSSLSLSSSSSSVITDTTPNSFNFQNITNAQINTSVTSNTITVSGINAPATINITGGQYAIDNGAFTNSSSTISNGQAINVRLTTPSVINTSNSATLNIGGVNGVFIVTTGANVAVASYDFNGQDTTHMVKNGFSFEANADVAASPPGQSEKGIPFTFTGSGINLSQETILNRYFFFNPQDNVWFHQRFFVPANYKHRSILLVNITGNIASWQVGDNIRAADGSTAKIYGAEGQTLLLEYAENSIAPATWGATNNPQIITNTTRVQSVSSIRNGNWPANNKLFVLYCDGYSWRGENPSFIFQKQSVGGKYSSVTVNVSTDFNSSGSALGEFEDFITESQIGKWIDIVYVVKLASAVGVSDGVIEMWIKREGEQTYARKLNIANLPTWKRAGNSAALKAGYLHGAQNSGYYDTTILYDSKIELFDYKPSFLP